MKEKNNHTAVGLNHPLHFQQPKPIRKAVIPVAGLGTRFLPVTKTIPKEMLPIVDKPAIQYIIEEALESGIEQIILVNSKGKSAIEDYFDSDTALESFLEQRKKFTELDLMRKLSNLIDIVIARQKKPLGLGHAIHCAQSFVGNEPFAVLLPDDLIKSNVPCLKQLIGAYQEYKANVIAVMEIEKKHAPLYGIIEGQMHADNNRVHLLKNLIEKPSEQKAPSSLAVIGRYILSPALFHCLASTQKGAGGEIQLTDALCELLQQEPIIGYRYEGLRFDVGEKTGFVEANLFFAALRPDMKERLKSFMKQLEF
ncbi:MAG: UTP--glucose-1-phosphate uridylyltransferase GalU [Deltaproteobacteria bacterium]|nr:UTP--glucose-1-phosphate uridylyltransferase GalU [Deltaproteobacteria bacterium]